MAIRYVDPEDGSGISYRLDGRTVSVRQFATEVDRFTIGPEVPEGLEVAAVLAHHHDTMALGS